MSCLESNSCYQSTIYNSERYADGAYGQSYYKVEYYNELIQEGVAFGSSETYISLPLILALYVKRSNDNTPT